MTALERLSQLFELEITQFTCERRDTVIVEAGGLLRYSCPPVSIKLTVSSLTTYRDHLTGIHLQSLEVSHPNSTQMQFDAYSGQALDQILGILKAPQ
jgi:hypothetical protein